MTAKVTAIIPKRRINTDQLRAGVNQSMREFARDIASEMSRYPPARPWQSRTPKSGPRANGQRTGQYGEGWLTPPRISQSSVTIINPVPYAGVVGGRNQARVLAARGWRRLDVVAPIVTKRQLGKLANLILPR